MLNCKAQVTSPQDTVPVTQDVEEEIIHNYAVPMPEFPGGVDSLFKFIKKNLKYTEFSVSITGTVLVKFAVMKDGSVDKVTVQLSAHPIIDREAVRVVKMFPKWIPGKINGEDVNCYYMIPIAFTLQ
jgi:protein TonB